MILPPFHRIAFFFLAILTNTYSHVRPLASAENVPESQVEETTCTSENPESCNARDRLNGTKFSSESQNSECSIFMAPSSIPNAGFGIFTTRTIHKDSPIFPYSDAPSIVVTDAASHNNGEDPNWNHVDYFWSGGGLGEFEADEVSESVVTFGALCNYHTYLHNVKPYLEEYDDSVANRFTDPHAGAFSYHKGHTFRASRRINAGEEIFADYSEEWLDSREGSYADHVPREEDFETGEKIMKSLLNSLVLHGEDLDDKTLSTVIDVVKLFDERAASTLPKTAERFKSMTKKPSNKLNPFAVRLAADTISMRHVDWIKQNGLCLDNIAPGKSTIPQAGQGAFAKRFLLEGSIITPSPLNNIMDKETLLMYDLEYDEEEEKMVRSGDNPIGTQLMMNYCFGHRESRLLLCPQTNSILINHCSTRKFGVGECTERGPNAKVQWESGWDKRTPEMLKMSLEQLDNLTLEGGTGLSFEIVATRDIQQGDEIFIDYGLDWETAWEKHVDSWESFSDTNENSTFTPVKEMDASDLRDLAELEENPYPENVQMVCYYYGEDEADEDEEEEDDEEDQEEENGYTVLPGKKFVSEYSMIVETLLYPCEIIEKTSDTTATIRILSSEVDDNTVFSDYPLMSITFRTKKYSSDQHLPGAFRHHIGIDDNIFPKQWKYPEETE